MGEKLLLRPSVTPTKQGVELGRFLATDTHGSRLQLTQRIERNAEAFGSHGRCTRFHILIPGIEEIGSPFTPAAHCTPLSAVYR